MFEVSASRRRVMARSALAILIAVGLYLSLQLVFNQAFLDPDSSHSLVLWLELQQHGLSWISTWRFTQDNWILGLFPLHFAGYAMFGAVPEVPLVGGWLIFVAAAGVSGLLAWQCGARRSAPWVSAILLFAGLEAHLRGLLAYSTTHNSSNLFGLVALALLFTWLRDGGRFKLAAAFVILSAVALSDPWLLPAFNLPLLLLALTFLAVPQLGIARSKALALLAVALVSSVLTRTQLLGLVDLPSIEYEMGGWGALHTKLFLLTRELGALLQLVPFVQSATSAIVSALIVAAVAVSLLVQGCRQDLTRATLPASLALLTLYSTGGISAAFLLNDSSGASFELGARLVVNCLYLVVPLIAVMTERYWSILPRALRVAVPMLAAGFALSGALSTGVARPQQLWHFEHRQTEQILERLRSEGLSYGYGSYWGAAANAVTALSKGAVVVRPISFDPNTGRAYSDWRPQSSQRWYSALDLPQGQRDLFIIVSAESGFGDGGCGELAQCEAALVAQFGEPARRLDLDATRRVFVWPHPLPDLWITQ